MRIKLFKFLLCTLFSLSACLIFSCKEEDEPMSPDFRYGPGPFEYVSAVTCKVNGVRITADYGYPWYMDYSSCYTDTGNFLFTRWVNTPNRDHYISITGTFFDLNQMTYPLIIWPQTGNHHVEINLVYYNDTNYVAASFDTTLFSITLNSFTNKKLTGTFNGWLYNKFRTDSVNVTEGQFEGELKRKEW